MKTKPIPSGHTRRSFMKTSVVAAVAVSSMTILSGLVNASEAGTYSYCAMKVVEIFDVDGVRLYYECYFIPSNGSCAGTCYTWTGPTDVRRKTVPCQWHKDPSTSVICDGVRPPKWA